MFIFIRRATPVARERAPTGFRVRFASGTGPASTPASGIAA